MLTARSIVLMLALAATCPAADFSVVGSTIRDPDGKTFVPVGANVNGKDWVWNDETTKHLQKIRDGWKFNFLRVNCKLDPNGSGAKWPTYTVNNDLKRIVDTYTPHGIVVCFELHDWTGEYPNDSELSRMTTWWRNTATTYKNNPYVWFNIMNEPGGGGSVSSRYLTVHQAAIRAIRKDAGATNVIVVDGASWGQDTGSWNSDPVPTANSGILTYGAKLKSFDSRTWENIVFSVHCYDQWAYGDAKLIDYIKRVQAAGHALMVGEFGGYGNNTSNNLHAAAQTVGRVALDRGVGLVYWHYQPGDGFALTKQGGGSAIDSLTSPSNLTWGGKIMWNATHSKGFGLGSGGGSGPAPTPDQALVVSPTTLSVPEGGTATFTVKLAVKPSSTVTVTVTGQAGSDITVKSGGSLSFTSSNWSTARTVTLAAAEDDNSTNAITTVTVSASGLSTVAVTASEADDDTGAPPAPAAQVRIDFQPASAPTVAGYLVDSGKVYGARNGLTYGWATDISASGRDRNSSRSADQRYDTIIQPQLSRKWGPVWELAVPNGTYQVRLICGDAAYIDSRYAMDVEGTAAVRGTPTSSVRWFEGNVTVTVTDGKLTLSPGTGAVNNKVAFIEVTPVPVGAG